MQNEDGESRATIKTAVHLGTSRDNIPNTAPFQMPEYHAMDVSHALLGFILRRAGRVGAGQVFFF